MQSVRLLFPSLEMVIMLMLVVGLGARALILVSYSGCCNSVTHADHG